MTFPFPYTPPPQNKLINVLNKLNLLSGLKLVLDAADPSSYTSGQKWLDTSGNGYDFFLGANGTVTTDDPTFNGPVNAPLAYWSFDGGDFFRYDTTNETWMQNIHKDNARYTFISWIYPITGVNNMIIGNNGGTSGSGGIGFQFGTPSTDNVTMRIGSNVAPLTVMNKNSVTTVSNAAWHFIAASVDEATGTGYFQKNTVQETFVSTYNTPSAGSATYTTEVGARGNANSPMPNGSRVASLAAWEGVFLSQAQIDSIFQATRGTFGV